MLRIILFLILAFPAVAGARCPFADKASGPGFKNAVWGLSVRDAKSGKTLVSCSESSNLVPGSILKLFVTAAALDIIGPGIRFKTRVYWDGKVSDGVLDGTVYIRGGGDPSFGSGLIKGSPVAEAEFERWAGALRAAGVSEIRGSVAADDSLFEGPPLPGSWAWEDIGNYYAAQPSALTVNDNLYRLVFKPGANVGDPAAILRTEPEIPGLQFTNFMKTGPEGSGDNGYIFNFPGQYAAVTRGTVPKGPAEFTIKGSIPDPALFAAQEFTRYLTAHGWKVSGKAVKSAGAVDYGKAILLAETEGATLKDIVFVTNKRSFNLYAELLLRHLALAKGKPGTSENGLGVLRDYLADNGVDTKELRMADASGLSRLNMVQGDDFTVFLSRIWKKGFFEVYLASLASPNDQDATGHIKKMGMNTKLEKRLKIKSGSLNGVRGYAGYLTTDKGTLLSFTSILNNYTASGAEIDRLHEAVLLELAGKF